MIALAYVALGAWPLIAIWLTRRYRPAIAVAGSFVFGALFLPELVEIKLPGLPALEKDSIIALSTLIALLITSRDALREARPARGFDLPFVLMVIGTIVTGLSNDDPVRWGSVTINPFGLYDAWHAILRDLWTIGLSFFIGRAVFRSPTALRDLFAVWVIGALVYVPFILVELRLSPQMHTWVYGFAQHEFQQTVREDGGYRPLVFTGHGLSLAIYFTAAVVFAIALTRAKLRILRRRVMGIAALLSGVLVLLKSVGALALGLAGGPLIWASPKWQMRAVRVFVALVLLYPIARFADEVPTDDVVAFVREHVSADRADSVKFRFDNERDLMTRARERPMAGWGANCRACIFNEWDGRLASVRDGAWIIWLGDRGVLGFLAYFGLLLLPVVAAVRRVRAFDDRRTQILVGALALALALEAIDLMPNASYSYLIFLQAGALAGVLEASARRRRQIDEDDSAVERITASVVSRERR